MIFVTILCSIKHIKGRYISLSCEITEVFNYNISTLLLATYCYTVLVIILHYRLVLSVNYSKWLLYILMGFLFNAFSPALPFQH